MKKMRELLRLIMEFIMFENERFESSSFFNKKSRKVY